ncbi:hypothetical protein [Pedobacter punctiformis]|uniref:Lipoprotein n=1 Tax=Pedobacter punctiformis TaxID=3004097 RepID=A0ABT4L5C4_9SPHI|nr:hypothetical protein [Pedobacter sp. HCMS5-2]MCZ4243110.1 hypothetical protein [Pedobacter sp. HCMS5-2]
MKSVLLILSIALIWSCNPKTSSKTPSQDTVVVAKTPAIGGAKDEHGCLIAAGYTWSVLKNECIRTFEQNKLLPVENKESYILAAYFLFNSDQTKAELFLPKEKQSIILERSGTEGNYIWKKDDLQIFGWKGYALSKNGKVIYHSE